MSKKAAFTRQKNPDLFIANQKIKRPFMPHSVALLVLSPRGDMIATAVHKTAVERGRQYIQSPPQLRMSTQQIGGISPVAETADEITVQKIALSIAKYFLNISFTERNDKHFYAPSADEAMKYNRLWYVGSARGNKYDGAGNVVPYGKWIHWVLVRVSDTKRVFCTDSPVYESYQWVSTGELALLPQSQQMSQRKLQMIDQALLMYHHTTGDYNKLVALARDRQKEKEGRSMVTA